MVDQSLKILGIELDRRGRAKLVAQLREWVSERSPRQIVTVNPEILVAANRNEAYRALIASADLRLADGAGILLASRMLGLPQPERFTGVELVDVLADLAATLGRSVYLLGADPGIATAAAQALQQRHPRLRIAGAEEGIPRITDDTFRALEPRASEQAVVGRIAAAKPAVLLVAFGHPRQEEFIARHKEKLGASILVGVGGTFDFFAGRVQRAPRLIQALWLEWLWRLIVQPWRMKRIWNATAVFLWLLVKDRIVHRTS